MANILADDHDDEDHSLTNVNFFVISRYNLILFAYIININLFY